MKKEIGVEELENFENLQTAITRGVLRIESGIIENCLQKFMLENGLTIQEFKDKYCMEQNINEGGKIIGITLFEKKPIRRMFFERNGEYLETREI